MAEEQLTPVEQCPACEATIEPEAEACERCGEPLFQSRLEDRAPRPLSVRHAEFDGLVPVQGGSLSEMMGLQAALGSKGFETFLSDQETKVIDPFITGGYCLGSTLLAHHHDVAAIREALADDKLRADTEPLLEEPESTPEDEMDAGLRDLARRIGWSAVAGSIVPVLFAPLGLVFAWFYYGEITRTGRSAGVALAFFATLFCLAQLAISVTFYLAGGSLVFFSPFLAWPT